MFKPVESSVSFPQLEESVAQFWKQGRIYEKTLSGRAGASAFIFYEGPPTANGLPHPGHCLTRAIKDLFPRYKAMRGYLCERKAGWDTHGLPVEVEVCKELGIHSKEEIEAFGVEPFIRKCVDSVFRYTRQWEQLTERLGFWIHLDEAYVTFHQSYVESVWWALKTLFDRGLLYQGHKIVWWWAQGGTALSSGEVGQGYREVADPSVYVRFPLVDERGEGRGARDEGRGAGGQGPGARDHGQADLSPLRVPTEGWSGEDQSTSSPLPLGEGQGEGLLHNADLLVWTTTPWTLPGNQFAAVDPDLEYVVADFFRDSPASNPKSESGSKSQSKSKSGSGSVSGSWSSTEKGAYRRSLRGDEERARVVVAKELVHTLANKFDLVAYQVQGTLRGRDLIGRRYLPPFRYYYNIQGDKKGRLKPKEEFERGPRHSKSFKLGLAQGSSELDDEHVAWRVVPADFVTVDTGTGVVHQAPAFGEVDFDLLQAEQARFVDGEGPTLICSVAPDGAFTAETPEYQGRWVKDCDRDIIRQLKNQGLLFHQEQYVHDYPFCWRAEEDPLIQYPRRSWFIRTTAFKEQMLANNSRINWLPEHIRDGRFGNFLETNVDWALSRERYWGTPLPIWVCEKTGYMEAVGSYAELLAKPGITGVDRWQTAKRENPDLPDDLCVHKPYIDAVTYDSPKAKGARMRRVSEVIDCWFDSGAMPFAQWGFPHRPGSAEQFRERFPADFISEALDQTRGWFYSLLAISTLLFSENDVAGESSPSPSPGGRGDSVSPQAALPSPLSPLPSPASYPHPFRNCIVLGLMLGEDGGKMSKSKRNYREPSEIFDRYGADALRWYFFANQPPWTSIRYSEQAIKDCIPEFLLRLWNVYSFFVIYANIDGFDPAAAMAGAAGQLGPGVLATARGYRPVPERGELDRWIHGELNHTIRQVVNSMDAYDNFFACDQLRRFVDALSNWYVRRSRDRFWSGEQSADKSDAYWTLYECLLTTCKLIAPFVPFLAEAMWQNLAVAAFEARTDSERPKESVHLCDYPEEDRSTEFDLDLSAQMALVREIVSLGRSARMGAKLKVRQPLSRVEVVLAYDTYRPWLEAHASLVCDELNVKRVEFTRNAEQYITSTVLPDLKRLGPRFGKRLPALRKELGRLDAGQLLLKLKNEGSVTLQLADGPARLENEDIQVRLQAKEGWAAAQGQEVVVVLATELTEDLIREGLARELVRVIQDRRKELGCEFTDRIEVGFVTGSAALAAAIEQFGDYIRNETLTLELKAAAIPGVEPLETTIGDDPLTLYLKRADR
jgi:isoleucyl-tRNA synthetase